MSRRLSPTEQQASVASGGPSIIGAFVLASSAAFLTLSVLAASLGRVPLLAVPGAFFFDAYGYLAFLVPAYLLVAAFILLDRAYRPDRIFALSCTVVPFLTLAAGAALLRDPLATYDRYPILESMGTRGIGAAVAAIAALECFGIVALTAVLFPAYARSASDAEQLRRTKAEKPELKVRFLPPPKEAVINPAAPRFDMDQLLPELKPLSSLAAEREFAAHGDAALLDAEGAFLTPDGPLHTHADTSTMQTDAAWADAVEALDESEEDLESIAVIDEAEVVDLSPLLSRDRSESAGKDEIVDPSVFFAEEETLEDAAPHPAAAQNAPTKIAGTGNADDLTRALSEAEAEAAAKSRAAEEAAAAKAYEGEHHASSLRKRRNEPYNVPVEELLTAYPDGQYWIIDQATRDAAIILKETLEEFNIAAEVTGIKKGPVITMFEILPAPGVKLSKIVNLQDNIALRLAASSVRIVAPIPGKHAVGIEVPNRKRNIVSFREMIEGELVKAGKDGKRAEIPVILGKDITGEAQTLDLVQTPHLLIAGATGSGKSVCVNSMILSILYQRSPAEVRLILIDPKIVELKLYNDIPHLLTPVITEPKRAFQALQYCIYEMERRYALLDSMGVRDVRSYNKRIKERNIAAERIPYIVVVIDEFADLMATTGKELESTVARLAAMSRAIGIHLVLATQRPSIDVITGLIKANIPSRIAFMVAGKMDSRIIIDMVGAEKLLGKGDMLLASAWDPFPIRMQGAFVSEEEVERVVEYVKTLGEPDYLDEEIFYDEDEEDTEPSLFGEEEDPLFEKALEIVHQQGKASASYIQRRLKIGYNRAARLVELMEDRGIVGPAQGSKPRDLLRGS